MLILDSLSLTFTCIDLLFLRWIHFHWPSLSLTFTGYAWHLLHSFRVTDLASPLRPWAPFTTGSSHREALSVRMEPSSIVGTGTSTTICASRGMCSAPTRNPQSSSPQFWKKSHLPCAGSRRWAADGHRCPRDALVAWRKWDQLFDLLHRFVAAGILFGKKKCICFIMCVIDQ
jgi:hypothetical protein